MNIAIVPARSNSKRLKNKNILIIKNLPMFIYVAKILQKSKKISKVIVSTESKKYIELCKKYNVEYVKRPIKLSRDQAEKHLVIVDTVRKIIKKGVKFKNVISVQPNSPELKLKDLHKALIFFEKKLYPKAIIKELICVNSKNIQNPSFRILTKKAVFQKSLSTKIGIYKANYTDIHTKKDFLNVKKILEKNN